MHCMEWAWSVGVVSLSYPLTDLLFQFNECLPIVGQDSIHSTGQGLQVQATCCGHNTQCGGYMVHWGICGAHTWCVGGWRDKWGEGENDRVLIGYEFPDSAVISPQLTNPVEETDFTGVDEGQAGVNLLGKGLDTCHCTTGHCTSILASSLDTLKAFPG